MGKATARGGVWRVVAFTLAVMLMTGCTVMVGGAARPARGLISRPLTGDTIKDVLPNAGRIQAIVHQPVTPDPQFPPRFGDLESMPNGLFANPNSAPRDCLAVAGVQQNSFRGAAVQNFAQNFWRTGWLPSEVPKAVTVMVGVVALRTAAEADALFTTFSQQWERCNGTKVTIFAPDEDVVVQTLLITDVRLGDSLLTVSFQANSSGLPPIMETRVLGVRVNCIVESEVIYGRDPDNSPEAIARVMMDKVSDLS